MANLVSVRVGQGGRGRMSWRRGEAASRDPASTWASCRAYHCQLNMPQLYKSSGHRVGERVIVLLTAIRWQRERAELAAAAGRERAAMEEAAVEREAAWQAEREQVRLPQEGKRRGEPQRVADEGADLETVPTDTRKGLRLVYG